MQPAADTKERVLDAAERLFGENGFAATSLRTITAEAGVNLAAVNYHFRSKEALLDAVIARRIGPLNRRRIEMLDALEAAARGGRPRLECILEAFLAPPLRLMREPGQDPRAFGRLFGRMYIEGGAFARMILREQFAEIKRRFGAALRRALPGLPPVELFWRMHFTIGVMAHTLAGAQHLEAISGGACDPTDVEGALERMIAFAAAGLRAAPPRRKPGKGTRA